MKDKLFDIGFEFVLAGDSNIARKILQIVEPEAKIRKGEPIEICHAIHAKAVERADPDEIKLIKDKLFDISLDIALAGEHGTAIEIQKIVDSPSKRSERHACGKIYYPLAHLCWNTLSYRFDLAKYLYEVELKKILMAVDSQSKIQTGQPIEICNVIHAKVLERARPEEIKLIKDQLFDIGLGFSLAGDNGTAIKILMIVDSPSKRDERPACGEIYHPEAYACWNTLSASSEWGKHVYEVEQHLATSIAKKAHLKYAPYFLGNAYEHRLYGVTHNKTTTEIDERCFEEEQKNSFEAIDKKYFVAINKKYSEEMAQKYFQIANTRGYNPRGMKPAPIDVPSAQREFRQSPLMHHWSSKNSPKKI